MKQRILSNQLYFGQERNFEGVKDIPCLLIAGTDPITQKLRRGPYLRALNPPPRVTYTIKTERLTYPKQAAHYNFSPLRVALNTIRFVAEHVMPFRQQGYSLIHSFFWDIERFEIPWIHENDQSVGQFMRDYLHINGLVKDKAASFFASYLNSELCRRVIVWSKWAMCGYIEDGVEKSKISIIPPPFKLIGDKKDHPNCNLLFIGRDYLRKGGDTVLRVLDRLSDFQDLKLYYVGEVWDKRALNKIRNNKRIKYYHAPTDRIMREEIFPQADIFILPTRADAFAISVVEAMSRGIPVVASNICALPEIVEDGASGFLSKPNDVDSLATSVSKLLENPRLREKFGERSLQIVLQKFSKDKVNEKLLEVYETATGRR